MNNKTKYTAVFAVITAILATIMLFFEVRYPVFYYESVRKECDKYGLPYGLVMSVIWTESKFDEKARSGAGATGLMQLMPDTARWCAEMLGEDFSTEMLTVGEYNVKLGTYYLKYLTDRFGDVKIALAAFNAGEGNVSLWQKNGEGIVFNETKKYVDTVLKTQKIYDFKLKMLK